MDKPCFASSSSWVSCGRFSSTTTQGGVTAGLVFVALLELSWPSLPSSSSSLSSSSLTRFFSKGSRSFSLALIAKLIGANEAIEKSENGDRLLGIWKHRAETRRGPTIHKRIGQRGSVPSGATSYMEGGSRAAGSACMVRDGRWNGRPLECTLHAGGLGWPMGCSDAGTKGESESPHL